MAEEPTHYEEPDLSISKKGLTVFTSAETLFSDIIFSEQRASIAVNKNTENCINIFTNSIALNNNWTSIWTYEPDNTSADCHFIFIKPFFLDSSNVTIRAYFFSSTEEILYYPNSTGWDCPNAAYILITIPYNIKEMIYLECKANTALNASFKIWTSSVAHTHNGEII